MPPALTLEPRRKRRASQAPLTAMPCRSRCRTARRASGSTPRRNREQIADTFVDYAKGRCDALVVFLIRDGNALGWRGYVAPPADSPRPKTPIEELSLPLGGASSLQAAHDAGEPYVGPPPSTARPVETRLWTALGAEPRAACT